MRLGVVTATIALCMALSGCAAPWHKAGATQAEFEQTLSSCQLEAQHKVPAIIAYRMIPGRTVTSSSCKHDHCTEETTYQPPTMTPYDQNEGMREQYERACLFRHGWSDEEQKTK